MQIQELERKTGLDRPTIRYYEREGLLSPERSENGYRMYSEADVQQLMKIKLLRQLGISVDRIRKLQQGSENFGSVIEEQIAALTKQIQNSQRAKEICKVIRSDGVNYHTMNAEYYLGLLQEQKYETFTMPNQFQERIMEEIHPWRRYFARMMDYMILNVIVNFVLIVILRIRPAPGNLLNIVIAIAAAALFIPVEAVWLHKTGTTPGKWLMGIRVEWLHGGNLSFEDALERSKQVYLKGVGLRIPFIEMILCANRYCKLTGKSPRPFASYNSIAYPEEMPWDQEVETEIDYGRCEGKRGLLYAGVLTALLLVSFFIATDAMRPQFRGDQLTIAQFVENYNDTLNVLQEHVELYEKLNTDGTFRERPNNVIVIGGTSEQKPEFQFETKNGIIQSVTYEHSWKDVVWLSPISGDCYTAALSLASAQKGFRLIDMIRFAKMWEAATDELNTSFQYKNLEISWKIETYNCSFYNGYLTASDDDVNAFANVQFKVVIN